MWKWFKWILLFIAIIFGLISLYFFEPWAFLPHKRVQMTLPFAPAEDANIGLIPMGETIEHNASNGTPDGHPGLDFGFSKETDILAVADGWITEISKKENKYNINIWMGNYRTTYQELNSIEPGLHIFSKVNKGQVIGQTGFSGDRNQKFQKNAKSGQIHWDFASSSHLIDRLCPVNYFEPESKARLLKIWNNVPADNIFRLQFPELCNGVFKGKEE